VAAREEEDVDFKERLEEMTRNWRPSTTEAGNWKRGCREYSQVAREGMMRLGDVITINPESIRNSYPFDED